MHVLVLASFRKSPAAPVPAPYAAETGDQSQGALAPADDLFDGEKVLCLFSRSESTETSAISLSGLQGGSETKLILPRRLGVGRSLPRLTYDEVKEGQAEALRRIYGNLKSSAKSLARHSGGSERSARNHLSGAYAFNLTEFFNTSRGNHLVREWGCEMMGVPGEDTLRKRLDEIEALIASARIMIGDGR